MLMAGAPMTLLPEEEAQRKLQTQLRAIERQRDDEKRRAMAQAACADLRLKIKSLGEEPCA